MPESISQKKAAQVVPGIVAGVGMLCILLAENWVVLSIGWAALAVCLILGSRKRIKRTLPKEEPRFEVGPLITADLEKINKWIRPVAIFVLLLGIVGLVVPTSEDGSPPQYGYAVFLIGIGVACLGIGYANRAMMVAGYGLWAMAGGLVIYSALASASSLEMAQSLTLGIMLLLGGGFAAYGFLYGRTRIYEDGLLLPNGISAWQQFDQWAIKTANNAPVLQLTIGAWQPCASVRPDQIEPLQEFLAKKFNGSAHDDETSE